MIEYVNKRIEELTVVKTDTFNALKQAEQIVQEEKEILEIKMKYYLAAGALAEMEELKRVLNR
ncbi:hypothetical protein [Bacillus salipaludis]|uniref:Uncharacterized protein n=1 Tax=Bacillus salipaludis TaxID=2547811 RepID=A0ABW8RF01_9BACI